jgi:hypothetical protein
LAELNNKLISIKRQAELLTINRTSLYREKAEKAHCENHPQNHPFCIRKSPLG